jgi:ABC-type multidrug transport system ATPase subunit
VKVVPSDSALQENVLSQFNKVQQSKEARRKPALKTILDSSFGCVKPGEMLLVLGRPGSGCTTLLKMLANKRKGYEIMTAPGGTQLFNILTDYQIRRRRWTGSLRNP